MLGNLVFFGFSPIVSLLFGVVLLAILVFEIAMIVSAIQNKNITSNTRVLWIIGMLLLHPFVAIVYYFTDHKKRN